MVVRKFEFIPEIAKLGHVALVSSDIEKSLWFFGEVLGLEETTVENGVHYLRAWGDFEHHTLSLTAGPEARVDHIAWKAKRPEDVQNFAILLRDAGVEVDEIQAGTETGQGDAIRFELPSGHVFEIYYEMEKPKVVDPKRKSILKNQSYKAWRKGISPRRIDHVNLATTMPASIITDFLIEKLGFKIREYLVDPNGETVSAWMSVTSLVHDVAIMSSDLMNSSAELHHLSYWLDNAQDVLRAADILAEEGIEFIGPGKHGISQAMYLYVLDPGSGARVEIFSNGYLIFEPDWEPIQWSLEEMAVGFTFWGEQSGLAGEPEPSLPAGKVLKEAAQ